MNVTFVLIVGSLSRSALAGCWQLSSCSSNVLSGHEAPLNQRHPPSLWVPPFRDMVSCCSCRSWLYCGIRDLGMWKKTKSSTHLDTGPMPLDLNKSAAASARLPNTPAEDEHPNARHLSIVNSNSDRRTIVPSHCAGLIGIVW